MSLPDPGTEWPPRPYRPVLTRIAEWDAWYRGDVADLHRIYQAKNQVLHRSQLAGGLAGWLARMWWGRPVSNTEPADKLHVPVAADLATASADLLFSEPPQINLPDADATTQQRLEKLTGDGLHATLLRAADVQAGLGGVYLRVVWDADVAGQPWLAPVHADAAVPEWRYDRLWAVTFWRELPDPHGGTTVFRHLERHQPGAILHGLYAGGPSGLGRRMALTDHPETAPLAGLVTDGDAITLPDKLMTAVYVPNQMPARSWRNVPAGVNLGRSDYEGLEPVMDKLDMVWSSWMRDIDLGKGRIILPAYMLQDAGPGKGAQWDMDRRAYAPINAPPGQAEGAGITVAQFAIRVQEHKDTCAALLDQIIRGAGYSASTFATDDSQGVQTATEVHAGERRSLMTRAKKALHWRPELASILEAQMVIDKYVFGSGIEPARPVVTFADSVQENMQQLATSADMLRRAEAASTETLVRMVHPGWDDIQVADEVARILAETGRRVEDPAVFTGGLADAR